MPSNTSIYEVFEHQKADLLVHLLSASSGFGQMVVFARKLDVIHELTSTLNHAGVVAQSLHANKKVELRERALKEFHEGKTPGVGDDRRRGSCYRFLRCEEYAQL